jgi:hypothetical protein
MAQCAHRKACITVPWWGVPFLVLDVALHVARNRAAYVQLARLIREKVRHED